MSQISKCPKVTVLLTYWESLGDVLELSYKSLLYCISIGSYCTKQPAEKKREEMKQGEELPGLK